MSWLSDANKSDMITYPTNREFTVVKNPVNVVNFGRINAQNKSHMSAGGWWGLYGDLTRPEDWNKDGGAHYLLKSVLFKGWDAPNIPGD